MQGDERETLREHKNQEGSGFWMGLTPPPEVSVPRREKSPEGGVEGLAILWNRKPTSGGQPGPRGSEGSTRGKSPEGRNLMSVTGMK